MALAAVAAFSPAPVAAQGEGERMLIIAHRGASGERPEHTLASYERAIDQGADYVEPDLVATSDGVLVARHENDISDTTDVSTRPEFEDRKRTKEIDGQLVTGWFVEDFTLAELRSLRAKERLPLIRAANARFDGLYQVPTFAEIVALVRAKEAETGRRIGIYPELKHPGFLLQEAGIDTVDLLVLALQEAGYTSASDPIFVQCFEIGPLKRLDRLTDVPLVQLVHFIGGPADEPALTYADMATPTGFAAIADYADAIGIDLRYIMREDGIDGAVIEDAKATGLAVHGWTLRKENVFLPPPFKSSGGEAATGDFEAIWNALAATGMDGVFTDDPRLAAAVQRGSQPASGN